MAERFPIWLNNEMRKNQTTAFEVARAVKCHESSVYKWKAGHRLPNLYVALQIIWFFSIINQQPIEKTIIDALIET